EIRLVSCVSPGRRRPGLTSIYSVGSTVTICATSLQPVGPYVNSRRFWAPTRLVMCSTRRELRSHVFAVSAHPFGVATRGAACSSHRSSWRQRTSLVGLELFRQ